MVKTVEFSIKNPNTFNSYLKRFASIDKSVLLELDLEKCQFIAKSCNSERSIVKRCILSFVDAQFELITKISKIRIKIGIYNISRLIKIIDQFGSEFKFIVKYDEVNSSNNQIDYVAISILLSNIDLKFNNECTSLNIFKYITDELYNDKIRKIDSIISFDLTKENIEKIRCYSELDKEYKYMEFINKDSNLYIKGKSFEFLIILTSDINCKIPFYKDQFDKIDNENYKVSIGLDKMLLESSNTNTETIISRVEINENYEETIKDEL